MAQHAARTRITSIVKGPSIEPGAVNGTAEAEGLFTCKQSAILEVVLPFLGRVYFFPLLSANACSEKLFEEGHGKGDSPNVVGWLAGIMSDKLNGILERTVLNFGSTEEDGQFPGARENFVEAMVCGCQVEDVLNGRTGVVYV